MLYLDGISLSKYILELKQKLEFKKITKLIQHDKFSISIILSKEIFNISINPELPIIFISNSKENYSEIQMPFLNTLKKYLLGGIFKEISQVNFDRILKIKIEKLNELGEIITSYLIIELMGKHSNIFILDEDLKIIDLLKKFSLEENNLRILLPGNYYKKPEIIKKISPFEINRENFYSLINSEKDLISKIEGFGKYSAIEAYQSYENYLNFISSPPNPTIFYKNEKLFLGACYNFSSISYDKYENFNSINDMINFYIENMFKSSQYNTLYNFLKRYITNEISKISDIIDKIKKEIAENKNFEIYKEIGDILAANLYKINKYQSSIELDNFYTNEKITIPLNPDISPVENLNKYYNKFNKMKRSFEFSQKRIKELEEYVEYLNSLYSYIIIADNIESLKLIEEEMINEGILTKNSKNKLKQKNKKQKKFTEFKINEQYKIIVGKNNIENDFITFKIADKNDLWLHVKNLPGSHVIIKRNNLKEDFSSEIIKTAAEVAAFYSSAKNEKNVIVDYTLRKNVTKPNGAKPGFVIYRNEKSIIVNPKIPI